MKKALLIGLVLLFSISIVFAAQPLPHAFEGQIFSDDGSLTSGKTMIVKLDGAVTGQTTIEGNSFKITVIDNIGSGGLIEFFMGNEKAEESFYFKTFEVTKTDLTFDTIPDETIGDCGDGICAVEECSFCAIDCPVSKCNSNNACDASIGEDYITAPNDCTSCGDGTCNNGETCSTCAQDCGACPVTPSGGGSGGGGGGGSGGGGSQPLSGSSDSDFTELNINRLNEESEEIGIGGGMTGGVIGAGLNKGISTLLVILFIFLFGVLGYFGWKRHSKK